MEITLEQMKEENTQENKEATSILLNNALFFIEHDEVFGELWIKLANKMLELPEYHDAMNYLFEKSKKDEENGTD